MEVHKFGGASIRDAQSIINLKEIVKQHVDRGSWIVISAMGKTTNALETILATQQKEGYGQAKPLLEALTTLHKNEALLLEVECKTPLWEVVQPHFEALDQALQSIRESDNFGEVYDRIMPFGEMISTALISSYLSASGLPVKLYAAQNLIKTDSHHRRAGVLWTDTDAALHGLPHDDTYKITQGFIGATLKGVPTTLGREGSDFTAAIIGHCLNAKQVTIWKDVDGLRNGDPKVFDNTLKLERISYREAIELSYFGASIIHPKTIQPLQQKDIPLKVRSFLNPAASGTSIMTGLDLEPFVPCLIKKENQVLISISTKNLDFIVERHLSHIYSIFHEYGIGVNLMQNSAVTSSFCITYDPITFPPLLVVLSRNYGVRYNTGMALYSIRHYTPELITEYHNKHEIFLEQTTRHTWRAVCKAV